MENNLYITGKIFLPYTFLSCTSWNTYVKYKYEITWYQNSQRKIYFMGQMPILLVLPIYQERQIRLRLITQG